MYYPDFSHPNIEEYWTSELSKYFEKLPIDGLWTDMNEASNFCNLDGSGQVCVNNDPEHCPTGDDATQLNCCLTCSTIDTQNSLDFPPYAINNLKSHTALGTKTLSMSALNYNNITQYNMHNLYGLGESIITNKAVKTVTNKRPFLLTRSSFPGSGVHTFKWTGDNGGKY